MNQKVIFFYHSKPTLDPRKSKRRVTLCGLINDGILSVGVSQQSHKDSFNKALARKISEARAKIVPYKEVPVEEDVRAQFISICREALAQKFKGGSWDRYVEALKKRRTKLINTIEQNIRDLNLLDHWTGQTTVITNKKLHMERLLPKETA